MSVTRPATIAMITDDFVPGMTGVGIHVQNISRELAARGQKIVIVTSRRKGQSALETWHGVKVYRVFSIPIVRFYQALPTRGLLKKIFIENKVDIIHCHYLSVMMIQVMRVAKKMGIPTVLTAHMSAAHLTQPPPLQPLRPMLGRMIARVYDRFSHVICVSSTYARQVERFSVAARVHYITNPIDFSSHHEEPSSDSSRFRVLFAGRLNPEKNVGLLLNALRLLIKDGLDAEVQIAGQGTQEGELRQLVQTLDITNRVSFLGHVDHEALAPLYAGCDVFVLPSTVETQGLVALEAMRFSKPVIVTEKIVSAKELVDEGSNGFIVDAHNPHHLADRLRQLAASPELRQRMGEAGLKKTAGYSIASVTDDLENVYRSVIDSQPGGDLNGPQYSDKRCLCACCGKGTFQEREEHTIVPSNAAHFNEEYFTVWRCAQCRSLHSFAKFPLDDYYLHSPFRNRKLNPFNRLTYTNLFNRIRSMGLKSSQRILFYGLNSLLFQQFMREKGYLHVDVLEEVMDERLLPQQTDGKYAAVIIIDFLERAEDPRQVFEFARRQLVQAGKLIVLTPDADRIRLPLGTEHIMHQPYRLHISSWWSLKALACEHGFAPVVFQRRHYQDSLVPFINFKAFHDLAYFHDGSLEGAINFTPKDFLIKFWRVPRFIWLGLSGGIWRDPANLTVLFQKIPMPPGSSPYSEKETLLAQQLSTISSYRKQLRPLMPLVPMIMKKNDQLKPLWEAWAKLNTPKKNPKKYFNKATIKILADFFEYLHYASDKMSK